MQKEEEINRKTQIKIKMIRKVTLQDVHAIAGIYNYYIRHTTATFELHPVGEEEMRRRILSISTRFPYFVEETEEGVLTGYCYAHTWKEKAAYDRTLESTVYVAPGKERLGTGTRLMHHLIEASRQTGVHSLIACITEGNLPSIRMHERLGFVQVSHFQEAGLKFGKWLGIADYQLML